MSNLIQLTANVVAAHASNTQMSSDELYQEIEKVYASLKALESGASVEEIPEQPKQLSIKEAFKKDSISCMICGKTGFKTLTRHLSKAHQLKPGQYRKQFNIPSSQSLTAKNYSESRRTMAIDMNLGAGLEKARNTRKKNLEEKTKNLPVKRVKASVPAVRAKAAVPTVIEEKATTKTAKKSGTKPNVLPKKNSATVKSVAKGPAKKKQ